MTRHAKGISQVSRSQFVYIVAMQVPLGTPELTRSSPLFTWVTLCNNGGWLDPAVPEVLRKIAESRRGSVQHGEVQILAATGAVTAAQRGDDPQGCGQTG